MDWKPRCGALTLASGRQMWMGYSRMGSKREFANQKNCYKCLPTNTYTPNQAATAAYSMLLSGLISVGRREALWMLVTSA